MKIILNNIELVLSLLGLLVIWIVPEMIDGAHDSWMATAIIATGVGVLHGFIFWTIRRRQRIVRDEIIAEVQLMLKDQINSQLTIINLSAEQAKQASNNSQQLKQVQETVHRISKLLAGISDESLQRWKSRYPNLFDKA